MNLCATLVAVATFAPAATTTISTALSVPNAAVALSSTAVTATGAATLTNIGSGNFVGTIPLTGVNGSNAVGTYTITLSGGTITGGLTLPVALFESLLSGSATSGTGSATVTGGTGTYAGATGSFPNVNGQGSVAASGALSASLTGAGSIVIGGSTTPTAPTPTITAVLDAGSYTANIAQGSVFVVKGTNLSASGFFSFGFPLPTSSNNVQINFTPAAGGAATSSYLVYLYNQGGVNQLAAILPSTLAAGTYNVTVTNNGVTSAPFVSAVAKNKPGLITQDSSGTGLAVIQNYVSASEEDVNRFTTGSVSGVAISPAKPGQTLIAWATGLGPIPTADNQAAPVLNVTATSNVQVIVGGVSITPTFAGRAPGLAGEDQIDFVLPSTITTGCTVPFQISVNGILSNATFLAIGANSTATACTAPGYTTAQLQNLDQGGTITVGGFEITQFSINENQAALGSYTENSASAGGSFATFTGFQLSAAATFTPTTGGCQVITIANAANSSSVVTAAVSATNLDAGALTLSGPAASNIVNAAFTETSNVYSLNIATQITGVTLPPGYALPGIPGASLTAGTYTLKGAGGKDVGAFSTSITLGSPLTVTGGLPTTVNRSAGLTLNWTGGNSTDIVEIVGVASAPNASTSEFVCTTTAGAHTFTVPASILQQLSAVTSTQISAGTGSGLLEVLSSPVPASGNGLFSVPLTAGGSISGATFLALLGVASNVAFQ